VAVHPLPQEFVAGNGRPEHVRYAALVAGNKALGLQALKHCQDRRVSPAATLPARECIDFPHCARSMLPEHLQEIELIFAQR